MTQFVNKNVYVSVCDRHNKIINTAAYQRLLHRTHNMNAYKNPRKFQIINIQPSGHTHILIPYHYQ
jgi:hypothetical protein